jgi:hypothetical protein
VILDDRGQIILLAALAVSVCLITLAMYLISLDEMEAGETPWPGDEALENVIWAQDIGFKDIAALTGSYPWEQRQSLGNDFINGSDWLVRDITRDMLAHGIAYSCEYNNTLAEEYVVANLETPMTSAGGVLIKKSENMGLVCGCAYDVSMADGSARYRISRVVCWR